jgi:hypothetical protein
MKRTIKLTENDLRQMIAESVKNCLFENERQYNKGDYVGGRNGVVTDQLGVTYEQVRAVYAALYGYNNYDGNDETYEEGVEKWWKQILSNARRQNQSFKDNLPSRKMRRK